MSQQDNEEFSDYPDTDESSIPEKSIVFNQNKNFVEPIRTSDSRHVSRASSTASNGKDRDPSYDAQTASRLAEGTIRAFRDLALEEAVELNGALQYWTERWERPVLSWLEAGPTGMLPFSEHQTYFAPACFNSIAFFFTSMVLQGRIPSPASGPKSIPNSGRTSEEVCFDW